MLTMFDSRNRLSHEISDEVRKHFPEKVFRSVIPRSVRLSESPSHGLSVLEELLGCVHFERVASRLVGFFRSCGDCGSQKLEGCENCIWIAAKKSKGCRVWNAIDGGG